MREIEQRLIRETGITEREAKEFIKLFASEAKDVFSKNKNINFPEFGKFKVKINRDGSRTVDFSPSRRMAMKVNADFEGLKPSLPGGENLSKYLPQLEKDNKENSKHQNDRKESGYADLDFSDFDLNSLELNSTTDINISLEEEEENIYKEENETPQKKIYEDADITAEPQNHKENNMKDDQSKKPHDNRYDEEINPYDAEGREANYKDPVMPDDVKQLHNEIINSDTDKPRIPDTPKKVTTFDDIFEPSEDRFNLGKDMPPGREAPTEIKREEQRPNIYSAGNTEAYATKGDGLVEDWSIPQRDRNTVVTPNISNEERKEILEDRIIREEMKEDRAEEERRKAQEELDRINRTQPAATPPPPQDTNYSQRNYTYDSTYDDAPKRSTALYAVIGAGAILLLIVAVYWLYSSGMFGTGNRQTATNETQTESPTARDDNPGTGQRYRQEEIPEDVRRQMQSGTTEQNAPVTTPSTTPPVTQNTQTETPTGTPDNTQRNPQETTQRNPQETSQQQQQQKQTTTTTPNQTTGGAPQMIGKYLYTDTGSGWTIQIASYGDNASAQAKVKELKNKGIANAFVEEANVGGSTKYRVKVRGFKTLDDAKKVGQSI